MLLARIAIPHAELAVRAATSAAPAVDLVAMAATWAATVIWAGVEVAERLAVAVAVAKAVAAVATEGAKAALQNARRPQFLTAVPLSTACPG